MTIKNIFSKTWLRAQYEIFKYARSFRRMTDEQVNACVAHEKGLQALRPFACVAHEKGLRAWCSQRSYYLAALRKECERRGLAYIQ